MKAILIHIGLIPFMHCIIREEQRPIESNSVTLDTTHEAHTTSQDSGSFIHPFETEDPSVSTIYYKGSKTISKKLTRVRKSGRPDTDHAFNDMS